ncbi:ABC transporter permease [Litorilinea aerophila]|uniref:ABC transporter permease n=1 Tax=Litorilinea aerophila TaxID=1204385 RepID=A0A540VFQ7_9CHLR|nr:ABC transporter permease [Litorilinea aerophila]MCC9076597.1 ABC transporter permease [Litorilinea aerophila]
MKQLSLFLDLCGLTLRRLASQPGLTVMSLLGVILAVGLLSSSAFFSQAVDRVILSQELAELSRVTGRIPFSTRVYFLPSSRKPVSLQTAEEVGRSVVGTLTGEIGLPLDHLGLQVGSGGMMLLPLEGDTRYGNNSSFINTVNLVYVADVADQMALVAGDPMDEEGASQGNVLDVWMHNRLAEEMGVHVGERFQVAVNLSQPRLEIRIRGLWQAKDPTGRFWFTDPDSTLRAAFLVTRADYIRFVEPLLPARSGFVAWHIILDDSRINPKYAARYANGFERGMAIINQYLPGARLDVSPLDPLKEFVQRQNTLTLVLLGFNVPAFGFLLYFLVLVSMIVARWQRRETALLVSRGMSATSVLGLTLVEELLLFVVGLPLGIALGMGLARWMGMTESFLTFTDRPPLPVSLQGINYTLIGLALGISLLARLLPVALSTRQSIVVQMREQARPLTKPFWQRAYLDVVLIAPTLYAYDQLAQRGTLAISVEEGPEQLFRDPLLILVPALFVVTAALLVMRIFPWLMSLFDFLASRTPWLSLHLALRQLGRSSQNYINPLLLVIVALALGVYSRSLAASLDQWLEDRIYYQVGTDISFEPYSESAEEMGDASVWIPPKDEFRQLPGVTGATRVGNYPARIHIADREIRGRMLAIDRVDFSQVAWFRPDFAPEPLGALMNRLALAPDHILVSQEFLTQNQLNIGDKISIRVSLADEFSYTGQFTVAGIYHYFPTVQQGEVTVIGNLEHLFTETGAVFPHSIWLAVNQSASEEALVRGVRQQNVEPIKLQDARALIAAEQSKMERVGIFGTLTVGFLAATAMAVLALLVHNYASLRERLFQFGVLRAMGLNRNHIIAQVVLEYGLLTLYGALAGAFIGLGTAEIFAPFFRIPDSAGAPLPPLIPLIAQDESVRLAVAFAATMVAMELAVLARAFSMRLFETLRMGHQG